jgi:hypothetical protein
MSRILRIRKNRQNRETRQAAALTKAADAILTAAGDQRLIKKFYPGGRDPFHGRRLTRAKRKTEQAVRQQAKHRMKVAAAGLGESKLIKAATKEEKCQ